MPQLDNVTFLSQVFWLFTIFLSFYIIVLRYMLPRISTILKVRRKKLQFNEAEIASLKNEESSLSSNYETILMNSLGESRRLLVKTVNLSLGWLNSSIEETNKNSLLDVNKKYIKTVSEMSGKKFLIENCIR